VYIKCKGEATISNPSTSLSPNIPDIINILTDAVIVEVLHSQREGSAVIAMIVDGSTLPPDDKPLQPISNDFPYTGPIHYMITPDIKLWVIPCLPEGDFEALQRGVADGISWLESWIDELLQSSSPISEQAVKAQESRIYNILELGLEMARCVHL